MELQKRETQAQARWDKLEAKAEMDKRDMQAKSQMEKQDAQAIAKMEKLEVALENERKDRLVQQQIAQRSAQIDGRQDQPCQGNDHS
jgi:hypothetical protein